MILPKIDSDSLHNNIDNLHKGIDDLLKIHSIYNAEMQNFEQIAYLFRPNPGEVPILGGVQIHGESIPKYEIGGDHITFVDFNKRFNLDERIRRAEQEGRYQVAEQLRKNKTRAGILLMDVEGHRDTDAFLARILHTTFLFGLQYELDVHGQVTADFFEKANMTFFLSSGIKKTISAIYGEIEDDGTFRFLSAGHPLPYVFSNKENSFVKINGTNGNVFENCSPLGLRPSISHADASTSGETLFGFKEPYVTNELKLLGKGDILLLYTDGLSDHADDTGALYFPDRLEAKLKQVKDYPAVAIFHEIRNDILSFSQKRKDDISYVVIKKT